MNRRWSMWSALGVACLGVGLALTLHHDASRAEGETAQPSSQSTTPASQSSPSPQLSSSTPAATSAQPGMMTQAATAPAAGETIIHTFQDEATMREFAKLWQQRQAILTRMAVLQAYWTQEEPGLGQVNQQLLSQYHLDVNKNYTLDTERKVLIELPAPPAKSPPTSGQPGPGGQPVQPQQP